MENNNLDQQITEKDYAAVPNVENEEVVENTQEISQPNESDDNEEQSPPQENQDLELEDKWVAHKKKLSKLQREKHRIAAEASKLKEENELLKRFNQTSHDASQVHYENSLKLKLEQAKEAKKRALELNDLDGIIEADHELYSAIADIKGLDNWKAQEMARQQFYQQYPEQNPHTQYEDQYYDEPEQEVNEAAQRWKVQNPWFDPNSSHYDPDKAEEVLAYAQAYDASLARRGKHDEYFSKNYFDRINNFAREYDREQSNAREDRRSNLLSASPVKRASNPSNSSSNRITLTEDDKFLARNLGIKEEDYIKFKREDQRQQSEKRKYQNNNNY
jgi:hypothetical protein